MPLKHDPEWGRELDTIRARAFAENRWHWWGSLIFTGMTFFFVLGASALYEMPAQYLMVAAIVISTLCLIAVIESAVRAIHAPLLILVATVEWVGRKQLGEYEPPSGGSAA